MKCDRCCKKKATERDLVRSPIRSLGVLALSVLSACSVFVQEAGPEIVCHATKEPIQCPLDPGDGVRATEVFTQHVMPLSPDEPLEIHWYDWDEIFDENGDVVGYTESPSRIHVRNHKVMMHELAHVALWRETGDADSNHEIPPGAWGNALNTAIEVAASEYGVANPSGDRNAAAEP